MPSTLTADENGKPQKTIFERSATTQWLIDELMKHKDSAEAVPYTDLKTACGMDVQKSRGYLVSACRYIEREHGVKFGAVRGIGMRRLDVDGVLDSGDCQVRKIQNISRRTGRCLENCLANKDLNSGQKVRLFTIKSVSRLFESLTKRSKLKEIEGLVKEKQIEVNYNDLLNSLRKKGQ